MAERIWVGIDVWKAHHWAVVVDPEGRGLMSRKVANDEDAILDLTKGAGEVRRPVDACWRCCQIVASRWPTFPAGR